MPNLMIRGVGWLFLVVMLAVVLGCGGGISRPTGTVSGTVTFDGLPLEEGVISFTSLEGGPVTGGKITNGKYIANNVTVGKNTVEIKATTAAASSGPMTYEKHEQQMREGMMNPGAAKAAAQKAAKTAKGIPADALGNNQTIEVTKGKQELDFDLKPAAKAQ